MKCADLIKRARKLATLADKATPGPWKPLIHRSSHTVAVLRGDKDVVSWTGFDSSAYERDAAANARLIAAAPDMARLLREMADALEAEIGLAERMASELDRMHEELVRAQGRTCYECPDCGAVCVGKQP